MPRRAATTGFPSSGRRPAAGTSAGRWRGIVAVAAGLLVAATMLPGCSSKPARKKGKSKAAAARAREEKPLLEEAAVAETPSEGTPVAAPERPPDAPEGDRRDAPSTDAAPPSEPEAGANAPPGADTPPEDAASAEPAPADASPPAGSLDDGLGANLPRDADRPVSPLVDPETAIVLDGGRIEVSSPKGWTRAPRSQNYLVRYQPTARKSIPSIVVTVEPAPAGVETVTKKNQADLVAAITARLAVDFPAGGGVKVIKKPAAAALGPHAGVAWAVPGSAKIDGLTETIDRFAWGVVLGGRLYVVEARGPRAKLDDEAKARAKAVASTLFRPADAPSGNPETVLPSGPPAVPGE